MEKTNTSNRSRGALKLFALALAASAAVVLGPGLTANAAPTNDNFANAIVLTGAAGTQSGTDNIDATLEAGEPDPGATNTVWFKWTCLESGKLTVDTFGSMNSDNTGDWDAILGIYTGASLNALTPLGATPKDTVLAETMTVPVTASTTYYIQLAGYANAVAASIVVNWTLDNLDNGAAIETFGANVAGSSAVITTTSPTEGTVVWTVPFGSTLATLAPTFTLSPGATCNQTNGAVPTPNFSTSPVHYIVTAAGASATRDYAVTVTEGPPSTACDITAFGANVAGSDAEITDTSSNTGTVAWTVPYGSTVTALAPTYTLSAGATCLPASGTTTNFTSPQLYTVTAQDGTTTKAYTVTATEAPNETALMWNTTDGSWDLATPNWTGQTSGSTVSFFTTANVIFTNNPAGGTITIAANMRPSSTTVSATSGTFIFSGGPIATGSVTKNGSGTLKIDGLVSGTTIGEVVSHTYSGGTIMNSGLLHLGGMYINSGGQGTSPLCTGTVGTGPVTLNGGTIEFDRVTETNALIVNGGALYSQNGWGATWSGPITLNGTLTCNAGFTLTCSGAISGTNGLIKTGTGPLNLSVSNSYTGPTTVTAGTLNCNNLDALGSGALSISSTTGTKVNLNYTGEHNVAALTLGGVPQTSGTYGSSAAGAAHTNDTYFAGAGMVRVPASTANDMLTFSFGALGSAVINGTNITMLVPDGTDVTSLAPTYTVSAGATGAPVSGTTNNFTSAQTYTVTAEDGITTKLYLVTVTQAVLANLFAWTNTASGNWSVAANWTNNVGDLQAPLGGGRSSYTLDFNTPGTYTATNNLNAGFELNRLNLGGPTLTLEGNGLAFVTNGPTLPTINQNSASAVTIRNGLALGNNTTYGGSGSGQVNLYGVISGAGSLTKNGSGTLRVYHVNNAFTGGTIINSGTLTMDIDAKLGSGPITLNGGTLYMWRYHPTNALTVNGGTLLSENGFGNSWDGPITLNTNLPCNVLYTLICSGAISGPGGLFKTGNGPMTLSGVNTYTGPTTVTAGTLKCDNVNALGNGGALSISGTAKVNLNYSGDHVVSSLTLGGIAQPAGTYGSSGSGLGDDVHFDALGTGTVTALASTAKVMFNVHFPDLGYATPVDSTGTNLVLYVTNGTPVTALAPTYDVSPFASGSPPSATSRDFTTPQTYTITAENGSMAHYSVAVAPVAAGLGYSALVEATGPVAFWPLGELTDTTAVDVVGGHNATYSGTYTLGVAGLAPRTSAAAVDFVAGTATAPYSDALNPTQFSVECWVRPHNTTVQYLVSLQDRTAGGRIGYAIWKNNGSAGFGVMAGVSTNNNGVAVNGGTVAEAGKSYHVVATYDGTTLKLYVNGNLEGSAVLAYMPATTNQPGFTIASRNGTTQADSDIQYVAVYNRALEQQEILTHYQNTPILKIGTSAGQVILEWEFGIGLQHAAPDVNGTYNDVLSATPPWPITPSGTSEFWRLKLK